MHAICEGEHVLTLTENASRIVRDITAQAEEVGGLRITADESDQPAFAVNAADQPEPGDQVVEQDGATIYLDDVANDQLDDKVLDAAVDEQGAVQFSLTVQQA